MNQQKYKNPALKADQKHFFFFKYLWTEQLAVFHTTSSDPLLLFDYEPKINAQGFGLNINHSIDDRTFKAVSDITDACNKLSEVVDDTISMKGLRTQIGNLSDFKIVIPTIVSLFLLYKAYYSSEENFCVLLAAITTTTTLLSPLLQKALKGVLQKFQDVKAQGLDDFTIPDAILSYILLALSGVRKRSSFSEKILNLFVDFGKKRKPFSEAIASLGSLLKQVCDYFGLEYLRSFFSNDDELLAEGLSAWCDSVDKVVLDYQSRKLQLSRDNFNYLNSLQFKALSFVRTTTDKSIQDRIRNVLLPYGNALKKIINVFESASFGKNQFRPEPLTIMLVGQPGVGKSQMTVPFLTEVLAEVLPNNLRSTLIDNPTDHIYMRKNEHKYWDGYHGQFITVFDDFGQSCDFVQNLESEYMDLIRVCNSFPHICHMAALENKGNVEFSSNLVFLTSNMLSLKVHSLVQPEAVLRRFDLCYLTVPKVEFCFPQKTNDILSRRLDRDKVKEIFDDTIYEFYPYDLTNSTVIGLPISYDELLAITVRSYKRKHNIGNDFHNLVKERLKTKLKAQGITDMAFWLYDNYWARSSSSSLDVSDQNSMILLESYKEPQMVELLRSYVAQSSFRSSMRRELASLLELLRQNQEKIKIFLAISAVVGIAYMGFNYYGSSTTGAVSAQVSGIEPRFRVWSPNQRELSGPSMRAQSSSGQEPKFRAREVNNRNLVGPTLRAQIGCSAVTSSTTCVLRRNLYELIRKFDNACMGYVTFLDGTYMLYPKHYHTQFTSLTNKGSKVYSEGFILNNDDIDKSYFISLQDMCNAVSDPGLDNLDAVCIVYPKYMHRHKNIRSQFCNIKELESLRKIRVRLSNKDEFGNHNVITDAIVRKDIKVGHLLGDYEVLRGYGYSLRTKEGDCGSILFSEHPGSTMGKILGFHCAGDGTTCGFATAVTQGDLPQLLVAQGCEPFIELYTSDNPVHSSGSSKINRSLLWDTYSRPKTKVAFLRPFDGIDPMANAISKYTLIPIDTVDAMFVSMDCTFSEIFNVGSSNLHLYNRLLTWCETVKGVPALPFVEGIPRSTSPGYPHSANGISGKTYWFGNGINSDVDNPRAIALFDKCDDICLDLYENKDVELLYTDFLKDERRPALKVLQGKTRLVSGSPLELTLITRKYYAGFSGWVMSNRIWNSIAVGINVYSSEWDVLFSHLGQVDGDFICGDFSNFDGSLRPEYLAYIGENIDMWYDDNNSFLRSRIWEYVYESTHINGSRVYRWKQGLPSGHPMTTIINSLYNLTAIRYAYEYALGEKANTFPFSTHVRCIVYGDDNVIRFSKTVQSHIDPFEFTNGFSNIGLTYGTVAKDGSKVKYTDASEVSFLKRNFRYEKTLGRYVAPLDLDVILEMPQWTKRGKLSKEITQDNVDNALIELSLHEPAIFDSWSKLIVDSSKEHLGFLPPVVNRHALMTKACARNFIW